MRFEKQGRVNSNRPTKAGVISSPDPRHQADIQHIPPHSSDGINLQNQVPRKGNGRINKSFSDDSDDSGDIAGSEDFVTEGSELPGHNKVDGEKEVMVHRRKSSARKHIN